MIVEFTKMHGSGNDFIFVDEWHERVIPEGRRRDFVRLACDRHFGIGSDGLIFVEKSKSHDASFVFYNPDGSRAEMCGNGIRCYAKYLFEKGHVREHIMGIETLAGVKDVELTVVEDAVLDVKVDMGAPQVRRGEAQVSGNPEALMVSEEVSIGGDSFHITAVGMGNPHAVLFVRNLEEIDVRRVGALIRNHTQVFMNGVNVHFMREEGANEFGIRTFERGVEDETLACGTGICAAAVAAVLNKKADINKPAYFNARGGRVRVDLEGTHDDIRRAYLIGPATEVFSGEFEFL
jgi:diaminopimelate epimerase